MRENKPGNHLRHFNDTNDGPVTNKKPQQASGKNED